MTWTYYAQRAVSRNWLDSDLQLEDVSLTWQLTGAGTMTATVDASVASQIADDNEFLLNEWSTLIYAEEDQTIRWGGIMTGSADAGNGMRTITCTSFSGYPTGRIWTDELALYVADAFDLVRILWDFVQRGHTGDLGVHPSDNLANFTIGSADPGPMPEQEPGESDDDYGLRLDAWQQLVNEPYELAWWNSPDCGNEIANLMQQSRTDYVERHEWIAPYDPSDADPPPEDADPAPGLDRIGHYIDLYPEAHVVRREDIRFVEGENLYTVPLPERDGMVYANYMRGLGAGTDRNTLLYEAYGPEDGRLQRDAIYPAKDLLSPSLLAVQTLDSLHKAQNILEFDSIDVVEHPNAPIGSWNLGDEIHIQTNSGFEKLDVWMRIVEWTFKPGAPDTASLRLIKPNAY